MTENIAANYEIHLTNPEEAALLFGAHDQNITLLEEMMAVKIQWRGEKLVIEGEAKKVKETFSIIKELHQLVKKGTHINSSDVLSAVKMANEGSLEFFSSFYQEEILKDHNGKAIRAKTAGQRQYIQAVKHKDVVFGIGPAGTGKTFLAVVMAVAALKKNEVQKIILTRPAVEAGESLGFLPGDLKEKVDPYLRPVYDALYAVFGNEQTVRLMDRGIIEIAPLAYMRGRTLEDAFVILDEAQNTTVAQMKMFLTRLGFGSKMIVNGDKTQIDLPKGVKSGLIHAEKILKDVKKIEFVYLSADDVVRHPVVAEIIDAYGKESD